MVLRHIGTAALLVLGIMDGSVAADAQQGGKTKRISASQIMFSQPSTAPQNLSVGGMALALFKGAA